MNKLIKEKPDDKTPPFRLETKEGSIIIQSLGQIICRPPYSVRDKIYPIGFKSVRSFFDLHKPQVISKYISEISDFGDRPVFSVTPESYPAERVVGLTPHECWKTIAEMVSQNSKGATLVKNIDGTDMFGLSYVSTLNKEQLLSDYREYLRPVSFATPPSWLQSKPKRKRRANPKYLESPQKKRKKNYDSDSDFDFDDEPVVRERERFPDPEPPRHKDRDREQYSSTSFSTYRAAEDDIPPNLFGIFSTLSDFFSKKNKR